VKRRLHDGDTLSAVEGDFEDSPHRNRVPDADRARIGYADFVAICHVVNPKDFGGFRVEANGLYVDLPPADATLTPEERAAVTWHPTGQYDKPALPLPCTLGQLRAFLPDAGMAGSIDEEAVAALLGWREYMTGWYNETLDADMWFGLASPTPHEAAMLLCQHNPHEDACDPMKTTTDETGPEDFKRLLRVFEDLEKVEQKARTLRQWLVIARDKGLKYHSWIDAYVMAQIEELPADTGSGSKVVAGATASAAGSIRDDAKILGSGAWPKDVWVKEAWKVGTKWMLSEEVERKERPGIVKIAKYVEDEFKKRDIRSKRIDDYLDWETIKHELTGITGRNPGENFKSTMGKPHRKKRPPT